MSVAIGAQGTTIGVDGTGAGTTFTPILGVKTFTAFDGSATEIDTTELTDTAKTKLLGLQDWGSFSMDANINYSDPGQAELLTLKKSRGVGAFKVTLPNGATVTFKAYVKSFPLGGGVDAVFTGTLALTITGDITITPASGG